MRIQIVAKTKEQANSKIDAICKKYNLSYEEIDENERDDDIAEAFKLKETYSSDNIASFEGELWFDTEQGFVSEEDYDTVWFKAKSNEEAMIKFDKFFTNLLKDSRKTNIKLNKSDVEKVKQDIIKDYKEANGGNITDISKIDQDVFGYLVKSNFGKLRDSIEKDLIKQLKLKPVKGKPSIHIILDEDAVDGLSIMSTVIINNTFTISNGFWLSFEDDSFGWG